MKGNYCNELLNNNEILEEIKKDLLQIKFVNALSLIDKEIFNK